MASLSDGELIRLIQDLESDRAERKRAWSGGHISEREGQAVCAFANDLPNVDGARAGRILSGELTYEQALVELEEKYGHGNSGPG